MRSARACLALVLLIAATIIPALAQETTTGTISGKVTDPAGTPVAGAVIIVTSEYGTKTAETDANGNYIVPFVRPGKYNLRVEAPGGFNTSIKNDVVVSLSQRTEMNFKLETGVKETIKVVGESPLVDTRSTSTGTNVKYDEFSTSVPLGRSYTDTFSVAPGVVSGVGTGDGNNSISGSSGLENSYLIDGVNVTNTGYGGIGAYNIVYGSLGTGVTSEFLEEVQIKTGGFEAEYGQALGGIINSIVKSGTNEFKGSVAWYSTPGGARSDYTLVNLQRGSSNLVYEDKQDFAVSVGGPLVKDKLWYFISYNPVITKQNNQATSNLNPGYQAAIAGNPNFTDPTVGLDVTDPLAFPSSSKELERKRTANNYAIKLTWQANAKHLLEFSVFGDPATGDRGFQQDLSPQFTDFASGGGQSDIEYGGHNGAIKWNAVFSPKFFLEAQIAKHDAKFREKSVKDETRYLDLRNNLEFRRAPTDYSLDGTSGSTSPLTDPITPVQTYQGGIGFISNQDDENTQYLLKFTNIVSTHEVRYGVQYDDISYLDTGTYTGQSFFVQLPVTNDAGDPVDFFDCSTTPGTCVDDGFGGPNPDGVQDVIPLASRGGALVSVRNGTGDPDVAFDSANRFRVTRARVGPALTPTSAREYNVFAQDTWSITPRVILRAGVRVTQETITGSGRFDLGFATNASGGFTYGTSSYAPNRYSFTGNVAPRIGVSWDVVGDGKSRLFLNWGRYFERVPNDLAIRALSNEVGISTQEFTDKALSAPRLGGSTTCDDGVGGTTACNPLTTVLTQGTAPTTVNAGSKLPYVDELSGGYEFEVGPQSAIKIRGIYRKQGRVLEDVQVNSVEEIQNFYYGYAGGYPYDPFGGSPSTPLSTAFPAKPFGPYVLANPGTNRVPKGGVYTFPKPERIYKALVVEYNRRLTNNWSLYANYRYATLEGNYEGLFRNDNGQSDPNITSLYDFPSSPLLQTQFDSGPLPSDVRHVLKIFPSYSFPFKLRVGANITFQTGVPRTSMLAHPNYQNSGEIPGKDPIYAYWVDDTINPLHLNFESDLGVILRDTDAVTQGVYFLYDYTKVKRGNLGRTPNTTTLDIHADYPITIGKTNLSLMFDIFNVTDQQKPLTYDDNVELLAGVLDPDYLSPLTYQTPRTFRLSARWSF